MSLGTDRYRYICAAQSIVPTNFFFKFFLGGGEGGGTYSLGSSSGAETHANRQQHSTSLDKRDDTTFKE